MEILIAFAGFLLLIAVATLGAIDTRDGRDWQARSDWMPTRHEGD
jgi:hypothetical protein